jgi:uncharacterized membrane protein YhaH (DUF805 family)
MDGMLRYFEFSGRSTRMQYWMFFLVEFVLFGVAIYVDYKMGGFADPQQPHVPLTIFMAIVHVVPGITVQVRRLHDIGKSGAWYLLNFVPFGGFVLLFWACCRSEDGGNIYDGPAPSSSEPTFRGRPVAMPRHSTIPRDIRMGSGRTPSAGNRRDEPSAGRFI